jgi:MFS family permease
MLCLVPVGATRQAEPQSHSRARLRPGRLYRLSPVGAVGAIAVGLASGAFWTLAPVFAHERGMDGNNLALFMSVVILGGALAQFPLGRLSDFTDRRLIIGIASACAALAGLMLANPSPPGVDAVTWLLIGGFLYGATAFPIGSLTNAHLNDHADRSEMTEVANSNLFLYGVAAAAGPLFAAAVINVAGLSAIFFYTATIHAGFVLFVLIRVFARAPVAPKDRKGFEPAPVQPAAPVRLQPDPAGGK